MERGVGAGRRVCRRPQPRRFQPVGNALDDVFEVITTNGDKALIRAAENGHAHVVEVLCGSFGADVNANFGYALVKAAENGHAPVVELLCGLFGADITMSTMGAHPTDHGT